MYISYVRVYRTAYSHLKSWTMFCSQHQKSITNKSSFLSTFFPKRLIIKKKHFFVANCTQKSAQNTPLKHKSFTNKSLDIKIDLTLNTIYKITTQKGKIFSTHSWSYSKNNCTYFDAQQIFNFFQRKHNSQNGLFKRNFWHCKQLKKTFFFVMYTTLSCKNLLQVVPAVCLISS